VAQAKRSRDSKKQMGQFMTPVCLAEKIVNEIDLTEDSIVLEPSFGDGSFIIAIIDKLLICGSGSHEDRLKRIFKKQLYGTELDTELYQQCVDKLVARFGDVAKDNNLVNADFFIQDYEKQFFDFIIGNPPFGGTFNKEIEDKLDKIYGQWNGYNLKKETYSFFIARSLELLKDDGTLSFISSNTFLTISTMNGLRRRLVSEARCSVVNLAYFSQETTYDMVLLNAVKGQSCDCILYNNQKILLADILLTDNFSWGVNKDLIKYFRGDKIGKYVVCTSGMTVGKNEYFLRKLNPDGSFLEPYEFFYFNDKITVEKEMSKVRLGKMSAIKKEKIRAMEKDGATVENVKCIKRSVPLEMNFPNDDYRYYNKANSGVIWAKPNYIIYWKDDGKAVYTYKKNGNWYLHGVGGKKYFGKGGLTWQLISSKIKMKILDKGFILDSGAPCAFLRDGVAENELLFILGWTLTNTATTILKTTINHTRNIQSKDIERLPYPWWIGKERKNKIIEYVSMLVASAKKNKESFSFTDKEIICLDKMYEMDC
jgi:hypothetical protein